jgi:signal transduction histidine kinase
MAEGDRTRQWSVDVEHGQRTPDDASLTIGTELSLPTVLRRITDSARRVARARYAALGVFGANGALEHYHYAVMDDATVADIGEPPQTRHLLGALRDRNETIRIRSVTNDARFAGLLQDHLRIDAFLGVPISTSRSVHGSLYLAEPVHRSEFSVEDEELVLALAATAGIAIENARRSEEWRRQQDWLHATANLSKRLPSHDGRDGLVIEEIMDGLRRLTSADLAAYTRPTPAAPDQMQVEVVSGLGERKLFGLRYDKESSLAWRAMQNERGVLAQDGSGSWREQLEFAGAELLTQGMALPLQTQGQPRGAIVVGRIGERPFTEADLGTGERFAALATLALELAEARNGNLRLGLLEERDRINRALLDDIVQRLFAAGIGLEQVATMASKSTVEKRVMRIVADLDEIIGQVRATRLALQDAPIGSISVRRRIVAVLQELAPVLGFEPRLQLSGPLNTLVSEEAAGEVEGVLRESLTGMVQPADAHRVDVLVSGDTTTLEVVVVHHGSGPGPTAVPRAVSSLRSRAERHGGSLDLQTAPEGGLKLRWSIPLQL